MKRFLMYGIPKSLLLKIIIALLIILGVKDVFAQEFNVSTSDITCPLTSGTGKYCGAEVYYTGTSASYNIGTRYDGRLNRIWFNLIAGGYADSEGFEKGHTYTVSMNMATNDWNNKFGSLSVKCDGSSGQELKKGGITYVSYKKIKFSFQAPSDRFCQFVYVDIRASSGNTITQISNWNLSSLTISDSSYSGGSTGGSSGGTTTDPNQSIIDANNQNTTQIIDNQNQNTNDIISSIQETTSQVSDTITNVFTDKCNNYIQPYLSTTTRNGITITNNQDGTFTLNGTATANTDFRIDQDTYNGTQHLFNLSSGTYTLGANLITGLEFRVMQNSTWQSKSVTSTNNTNTFTLNSNWNDLFTYIYVFNGTTLNNFVLKPYLNLGTNTNFCPYGSIEQNKIDALNDKIDGLGRVIEDSQVENGVGSSFFNDFDTTDNGGISAIITKPLVLINSLLDNNDSCSDLSFSIKFPSLDSKNVSFPSGCILWNNVPNTVVNIYHMFIVGFCSYYLLKRLFKDVEDLKNPENDKVEVIDL